MPSTKKRINLTISDNIYQQLQAYKNEIGIESDATACLQMIVQQLRAHETNKVLAQMMREASMEQLLQISNEGLASLKDAVDKGFSVK